jgi:hypothetical protein
MSRLVIGLEQSFVWIPEGHRKNVQSTMRRVTFDGHQVADKTSARFEYSQLGWCGQTAPEDDEV